MKKTLSLLLVLSLVYSTFFCVDVFAEDSDLTMSSMSDYEYEMSLCDDEPSSEAFGYRTCEPITDPQKSFDESLREEDVFGEEVSDSSGWVMVNPSEEIDRTLVLDSITTSQIFAESDVGNYKNLVTRQQLDSWVKAAVGFSCTPVLQGSCADDDYFYYAFQLKTDSNDHYAICMLCCTIDSSGNPTIIKHRVITASAHPNLVSHMNDMTYNSLTDQLVITCSGVRDCRVCFVNASYFRGTSNTLTYTYKNISCQTSAIEYNRALNKYVVNVLGDYYHFCILDAEFNLVADIDEVTLTADAEKAYHSGVWCDDNYIYSLHYLKVDVEGIRNVLAIYDWQGYPVQEINLQAPVISYNGMQLGFEFENIAVIKDKIMVGLNISYGSGASTVSYYYLYDISDLFMHIEYYVSGDISSNLSSGATRTSNILYDLSTPLLKNVFKNRGYVFAGWNIYKKETGKWMYVSADGSTRAWYAEGSQPSGYTKIVYMDKLAIARTCYAGQHLMFCATWTATNRFYVSFDANGGTGTMPRQSVTYGTSTQMPANTFTKTGRTFQGWNLYSVEMEKWLYTSADGSTRAWYKEGSQPRGYLKTTYSDSTSIASTAYEGRHLIFYAKWNEFVVIYDANGQEIKSNKIKAPLVAVYGSNNTIAQYTANDISGTGTKPNPLGYRLHRFDADTWRAVKSSDSTKVWLNSSQINGSTYVYDVYTGTNVISTAPIGTRLVLQAQWDT